MSDLASPPPPSSTTPTDRPTRPPEEKKGGGKGCLSVFLVLGALFASLVVLIVAVIFIAMIAGISSLPTGGDSNSHYLEETVSAGTSSRKVVIIRVHGIITSTGYMYHEPTSQNLVEQLRKAAKDKDVVAIVLDMNTPGGEIVATDEVYNEIQKVRDEHHKTVVTCMRSMAASGGYYLAAGTDWIVANRLTFTGSVGVMIGNYNLTELLEKWGIDANIYTSGEKKDILSMARKPTEEEAALMQQLVDESFHEFALIVSDGREIPLEQVKNPAGPIGDGRVLSGSQALELGLVDELGYLENAIAKAKSLAKANNAKVVRYTPRPSFGDLFATMRGPDQGVLSELIPPEHRAVRKGRLYFLAPSTL